MKAVAKKKTSELTSTASTLRLIKTNDPYIDMFQMNKIGQTLLMSLSGQPREFYSVMLELGADATARDRNSRTVLHYFMISFNQHSISLNQILEGGEILALLIHAGASPEGVDRFGHLPPKTELSLDPQDPIDSIILGLRLAVWHQGLRICGLDGPKYCSCDSHRPTTSKVNDRGFRSEARWVKTQTHVGTFKFATFEEELSVVLQKWDRERAESYSDPNHTSDFEAWFINKFDTMVQELLCEVKSRLERLHLATTPTTSCPAEAYSRSARIRKLRSTVTQPKPKSKRAIRKRAFIHGKSQDIHSLAELDGLWEDEETSASDDSGDGWESAPE